MMASSIVESYQLPKITSEYFESVYFVSSMKFITVTLDPSHVKVDAERPRLVQYLFETFHESLIIPKRIDFIYGCVEWHKSGLPHLHFIANQVDFSVKLKTVIKPYVTRNMRNHKAVDEGFARFPNSIDYINKDEPGKLWFGWGRLFPDIDPVMIRTYGLPPRPPFRKVSKVIETLRTPAYLLSDVVWHD